MERTTAAAARPVAGHGPIPGHVEDAAGRAALLLCALGLGVAGAIGSTTVAVAAIPKIHA